MGRQKTMRDEVKVEEDTPIVVGVGASAGGLEAFQDLFSRLSANHDFALVLVQHLDPDHESLLQELLSKRTNTPVHTIKEGMKADPGNIYLIPPGASLTIKNRVLHLAEFDSPRGQRRPIDTFFESLAEDLGRHAVAIVLSGTGSDGSNGVRAVKERGGLVFAQDVNQAKYDGMPKSAIATGAVDLTLKTDEMIEVLNDFHQRRTGIEPTIENDTEFVTKVFKHLRYQTGHDFTDYKHATLRRRLSVRMSVLGIVQPADYVKRLIQDRNEAARLFRDVLINVTGFFRDPEAFESLRTKVIPEILKDRGRDDEVRVWVPGCSTGQEAYTIAMLLQEELSRTNGHPSVVVFGTDIDDEALRTARAGVYANTISDEVPQQYLDEYFVSTPDGYEVGKQLRGLVRFSHQSLIKDPPFSKLDLISCRNVTIYFDKKLQDLANSVFHYALKPHAYLMLGLSEAPRELMNKFDEVDSVNRLYQRDGSPSLPLNLPSSPVNRSGGLLREMRMDTRAPVKTDAIKEAVMARHMPPYIALDERNTISFVSSGAEKFLRIRAGRQKLEITTVIAEELAPTVRRLLRGVPSRSKGEVASALFSGEISGKKKNIKVSAERTDTGGSILIFLPYETDDIDFAISPEPGAAVDSAYVEELETELDDARQTIQTTVEELETSNEELKSSNEEMMSMNEELQSANEELSTINEELQGKVNDLNELNSDLASLIESTGMPTIFLDHELSVRRFTPEARTYFRLTDVDVGRYVGDLASDLPMSDFVAAVREVTATGRVLEKELQTSDGSIEILLRVVPAEGPRGERHSVATLVDVSDLRRYATAAETARKDVQRSLAEIEKVYETSPIGMAMFDTDLRYIRLNDKLAEINGMSIEDHYGKHVSEVVPDVEEAVLVAMNHVLKTGEAVLGAEVVGKTAAAPQQERAWVVDFYPIFGESGIEALGANVRDITEQRATSEELKRVMRELQHRVKNMLSNVAALVNRAKADKRDPATVLEILSNRIVALSNTHKLLTVTNWRHSNIKDLIKPELIDVYGSDVITIRGPDVILNSRATLALGMVIHELATNAAKYGSLSSPEGRLHLNWSRIDEGDGELLRLVWSEKSGPEVEKPRTAGFGSTLIRSVIESTLDGSIDFEWKSDGLVCRIDIDWQTATEGDATVDGQIF